MGFSRRDRSVSNASSFTEVHHSAPGLPMAAEIARMTVPKFTAMKAAGQKITHADRL